MKALLKTSTAAAVLTMALGAPGFASEADSADETTTQEFILPSYGSINPFYGSINPFYGSINPFYGQISPFWGDVQPFWGQINPFYGEINPFYGVINPFWGDISSFYSETDPFWSQIEPFYGDINSFWGEISAFWGSIGPFWGDINSFWGDIDAFTDEDYARLTSDLESLFAQAEAVFGPAVEASTGMSFADAFLADLTARFGIDLSDPQSLAALSVEDRSAFFLAFYDGLMGFTGVDHVDHWMPAVGWSPALSQRVGGGSGVTVGVVDFSAPYRLDGMRGQGGGAYLDFNHGYAVASLISADMDGEGIMGVAQNVALRLENPFDESLTANWETVARSINALMAANTDIINLSLGVSGWTFHSEWANVFGAMDASDILFVFAAGNDGSTQVQHVDWTDVAEVENLLIVGSVNPNGDISSFSNRPGEACLSVGGACQDGFRLMDRFLVAPGEMILVPDGEGGVVRMSGTSFAAPLVSGAAALVKGRWTWLNAGDVASVLLWSAEDLGAPGVDPVYGWGKLDIDASFRPFNPENLYHIDATGSQVRSRELGVINGQLLANVDSDAYVVMFEDFRDTFRDFQIALEDITFDSEDSVGTQDDAQRYMEERNQERGNGRRNFQSAPQIEGVIARSGTTEVRLSASPLDTGERYSSGELSFQVGLELVDTLTGNAIRFGHGEGALAFSSGSAFGLASDHRPGAGGVNPILGFASGGGYVSGSMGLGDATGLSFAATTTHDPYAYVNPLTGETSALFATLEAYSSSAIAVKLDHAISDRVTLDIGYTQLQETDALLGAQGLGALGFDGRTLTHAATLGAQTRMPFALNLAGSATLGRTVSGLDGPALSLAEDVVSTAFQVSLEREGVFGRSDGLRFSLIQPLHAESGALAYTGQVVSNRQTGALEAQSQRWALSGERTLAFEVLYAARSLLDGRAGLSLFARADAPEARFASQDREITGGLRFDLDY